MPSFATSFHWFITLLTEIVEETNCYTQVLDKNGKIPSGEQ